MICGTYLQDANFIEIVPNMWTSVGYQIKINEVSTNDNIFVGSQGPTNKYSFYTIDLILQIPTNFKLENESYFKMYIREK